MWYDLTLNESETLELSAEVVVPTGSPWFKGHFPGNPVLPGVAQLEMVMNLMRRCIAPSLILVEVSRVRFKKMIVPDDRLRVTVEPQAESREAYTFRIFKEKEIVTTGKIRVAGGVEPAAVP